MKQVKVRKNFSIGNKKFKSLIEVSEDYDVYVAQNTHDEGKIVKGMKFFLFKKGKENPLEEIENFRSKFLDIELENFFKSQKIQIKEGKSFRLKCQNFNQKENSFELTVKIENKEILFFSGKRRESGTGYSKFNSFMKIADEKFLIRIFREFLLGKGLVHEPSERSEIVIPGNVPSSKNSKQMTKTKLLVSSKTVRNYVTKYSFLWLLYEPDFKFLIEDLEKPYKIEFLFTRESKRSFDYINIVQLPLDLMQRYGWLENDDAYNVKPFFANFHIDKENPGIAIKILKELH